MLHIIGRLGLATVAVMLCIATVPLGQVHAERQVSAKDKQVKKVELSHPVSVKDALIILRESGNPMQEIGLGGENAIGGFRPNKTKSIESQVQWAESAFQRRYQITPVVTSINFSPSTAESKLKAVKTTLEAAAQAKPAKAIATAPKAALKKTSTGLRLMEAQDIPSYFPTTFWGVIYDVYGTNTKGYSLWIDYLDVWGFDSNPADFPDDWGLEYGVTSYNSNITGITRPICGFGANTDFWSSTYSEGFVWSTYGAPAAAAPYADYNIDTDSCQNNSVEVGFGYPQSLLNNYNVNFFVELEDGTQSSSLASASARMVSNDCNDLNVWPGTNCMGLNVLREIPEGYGNGYQMYVNANRGWTIPGCMAMQDGMEEPNLSCD